MPGDLVVLAIGVVIALLGAAVFVAAADHRHTLGKEQRGEEIALLAGAQGQDAGILGLALGAAVPRVVARIPVLVVFAVGLVVLLVVGNEIAQAETVVCG